MASDFEEVRLCPTLPQGPPCSTIGAESLSFRVRNVTGRFPLAMAAVTLLMCWCAGSDVETRPHGAFLDVEPVPTVHLEPHSGREHSCRASRTEHVLSSHRLISTGQLRRSFVPASTSGLSTQSSTGSLSLSRRMEVSSRRRLPA